MHIHEEVMMKEVCLGIEQMQEHMC